MFMILTEAMVDPVTTSLMGDLLEQYGLTGVAFGALLTIMLRQNKNAQKRITDLEGASQEQHEKELDARKSMLDEYVELVKNNLKVVADLTGVLDRIKDTLERIERKSDG
jgi:hypothetical protein